MNCIYDIYNKHSNHGKLRLNIANDLFKRYPLHRCPKYTGLQIRESKAIFNPIPNIKFLDMIILRAFADDKIKVAKLTIFLFDRAENTVGYQHFLFFPVFSKAFFQQCFQKPSFLCLLKVRMCGKELNTKFLELYIKFYVNGMVLIRVISLIKFYRVSTTQGFEKT